MVVDAVVVRAPTCGIIPSPPNEPASAFDPLHRSGGIKLHKKAVTTPMVGLAIPLAGVGHTSDHPPAILSSLHGIARIIGQSADGFLPDNVR